VRSGACAALLCLCLSIPSVSAGENINRLRELFHQGRYNEADALIPAALREASRADSAEICYYEASAERVAELSEIKAMEITRKFPDSPYAERALLLSAVYQFEIENLAKSENLLRKILKDYLLTPIEPEIRLWLGRNYLVRGEFRSARVELLHGINSLPDFPQTPPWVEGELHYWLGETCERAGDMECALEAFQYVALQDVGEPLAACSMIRLADILERAGKKEEALIWRKRQRTIVDGKMLENAVLHSASKNTPVQQPAEQYREARTSETAPQFWVQVGSFSSRSNADNLGQTLTEQGLEVETERVILSGSNYYRVRVGPFSDREKGLDMLRRLRDMGIEGRVLSGDQ